MGAQHKYPSQPYLKDHVFDLGEEVFVLNMLRTPIHREAYEGVLSMGDKMEEYVLRGCFLDLC